MAFPLIQKIETPKRYRAWDTSSSIQNISQNYIVNGTFDSTADADDDWTKVGGGIAIGSGKLTWTTDGENQAAISKAVLWDADSMAGKTVRLKYRVVTNSDNINFYTGGYSTSGIFDDMAGLTSTVGYHERILTIRSDVTESSGQKLHLHVNHTAGKTFEIDDVELYEVESLGNNNHGQIYSGRALEFDGVSDYLTTGYGSGLNPTTESIVCAAWAYPTANIDIMGYVANGTNQRLYVGTYSDKWDFGIQASQWNATPDTGALVPVNYNTWARVVVVLDSAIDVATLYVNGVATATKNYTSYTLVGNIQISGNTPTAYLWDGMLSDAQVWNATWTAEDVAFDYANPEKLALNRGGTSLTESNLKIWYPMNDGHRGQQSYVLDASNTGLGDEMVTNGDFSDGVTGWTKGPNTATQEVVDGKLRMYSGTSGSNEMSKKTLDISGREGVMYRLSIDASDFVGLGTSVYIRLDGVYNADHLIRFINGSNIVYFVAYGDFSYVKFFAGDEEHYVTIDNFSLKPVNDKNHATTVFYGDEFLKTDVANNQTFNADEGDWIVDGAASRTWGAAFGATGSDGGLQVVGDGSSTVQGVKVPYGDWGNTIVLGRRYIIQADIKGAAGELDNFKFGFGGQASSIFTVTASYATYTAILTPSTTTNSLFVYRYGTTGETDSWYLDNVSVKEVGTASGWTGADQQLDIPQTALQSYNQLMFFQGQEDSTADRVLINPTTSIFNQSVGDYNSISSWVWFGNDFSTDTTSGMPWAISGSKPNFFYTISGSDIQIGYNTGNGDIVGVQLPHSYFTGKWTHFVINWRISTTVEVPNDSDLTDPAYIAYIPEFFINGEKKTLDYESGINSNSCPTSATADVHIGDNTSNYAHVGSVTELSTWTKKLSQAEVEELYNDGKALDATLHSAADDDLTGYWRNNGLATWKNIVNPGTNDATIEQGTETFIQQAGADFSRDCQGFLMNRQKDTSALNLSDTDSSTNKSAFVEVLQPGGEDTSTGYFDSTNDGLGNWTIEFWFKGGVDISGDALTMFQCVKEESSDWQGLDIHMKGNTGVITAAFYTDSASTQSAWGVSSSHGSVNYNDGEWHHFVFSVDRKGTIHGGGVKQAIMVIDGICKDIVTSSAEASIGGSLTAWAGAGIFIGGGDNDFDTGDFTNRQSFTGFIDDAKIYSEALTALKSDGSLVEEGDTLASCEIVRNYNAGKRSHR